MTLIRVSKRHVDEYRAMWLASGKGCAICGQPFTTRDYAVVDHDHDTGAIRGCLHNTCNRAEGEMVSFAKRVAKENWRNWIINLSNSVARGGTVSRSVKRVARYTHKGVSVPAYLHGLAHYLYLHATPQNRMIHPSHRFPNEGGNVKTKNPRFNKYRRR